MSNYTKNTNFSAKDSLPTGDPSKIILGSLFDAEFDEIAVAIASKEDAANKNQNNGYAGLDSSGKLPTSLFGNTTVPDAALSSNVLLKNTAATISGTYTFSTAPVLPAASIADASLSSNVPLKNAASNAFTGDLSVSGTISGTISGNGSGLTSLNASNISSGTLADGRLSNNVPLLSSANIFTDIQTVSSTNPRIRLYDSNAGTNAKYTEFSGNSGFAINLLDDTGSNPVTAISIARTGTTVGAVTIGGVITGNGSGLTNIPDGALSSNVALKNAANTFNADQAISTNTTTRLYINTTGGTADQGRTYLSTSATTGQFAITSVNDAGTAFRTLLQGTKSGVGWNTITFGNTTDSPTYVFAGTGATGGVQIGSPTGGDKGAGTLNAASTIYQNNVPVASLPARTSSSTTLVAGQAHYITGNATLPALAAGEWVSIINNSGSPITISESLGYTTYWTTSGASVSTVTLAARGRLFAEGVGSSVAYVSGDITGFT